MPLSKKLSPIELRLAPWSKINWTYFGGASLFVVECHFVSHRDSNLVSSYFGLMGAGIIGMFHLALLGLFLDSQFCPIDVCIYLNTTPLSWLLQPNITLTLGNKFWVVRGQAEQILGIMPVTACFLTAPSPNLFRVMPPTVLWALPHESVDQKYVP